MNKPPRINEALDIGTPMDLYNEYIKDDLFTDALQFVIGGGENQCPSLQRKFHINYFRAYRLREAIKYHRAHNIEETQTPEHQMVYGG